MMAGRGNNAVAGGPAGHIPVLLDEVVELLDPKPGEVFVDGTFGDGGYSRALLAAGASVVGIDRDPDAIADGKPLSAAAKGRLTLVRGRFGALDDRLTGYRHALFDHGIDFDEQLVCSLSEGNTSRQGYVHITELLSRHDAPTAVFACSDEVAIGALGRLREEGFGVPDDIAIVGVDGIPYADYLAPRLTTVQVPKMQMGAQVVRMLHDRTTRPGESPISVVLPTTLIVRDSCGAQGSSALVTPGRRAAVPQPTV